jgi:hypothetical protein
MAEVPASVFGFMGKRGISLFVVVAALAVSAFSCGGGTVQAPSCTDFAAATNTISLNNVVGSDPTSINTSTPLFTIAADGGRASYNVTVDGVALGSVKNTTSDTACVNGPSLADGTHTIGGRETSPHSAALPTLTFKVDTVPPAVPSKPTLVKKTTTVATVSGTSEAKVTVQIYEGTKIRGGASADSTGHWTVAATLTTGSHTLTAVAVDTAGNHSAASPSLTLTM